MAQYILLLSKENNQPKERKMNFYMNGTSAYYMNDSVMMCDKLSDVRYGQFRSRSTELVYSFAMVDETIILTVVDSMNLNYAQAIDDGIQYLIDLHGVDTIGKYSVTNYQYCDRMNISTYYIRLTK